MKPIYKVFIFFITTAVMSSCAYKLSNSSGAESADMIPGQVRRIQIPLFKNETMEPGVEIFFTNALKSEALKSRVAQLENKEVDAEAVLQGRINGIEILAEDSNILEPQKDDPYLPDGTVLTLQYKMTVDVDLELKRRGSSTVLWSGKFRQAKNFTASQITLPVINTSNSLYNQSAKRQTLDAISKEMMQAAFDRMLENF